MIDVLNSTLSDHHRRLLRESAISDDVAQARGYRTATRKTELQALGFATFQRNVPALVIPIRDAGGAIVSYQARPDQPRIGPNGRPVKYESPVHTPPVLDVPVGARKTLRKTGVPLFITEGARKADAGVTAGVCCVSLLGVWSWVKRLNRDAREVLPDLHRVPLHDRQVVVAFDSDAMVKREVHGALKALGEWLGSQGAGVLYLYLPELEPGCKTGLDDFLAAGKTVDQLWAYTESELRELPAPPPPEPRREALPTTELLRRIETFIARFVKFSDKAASRQALALYVLHTWAIDAADCTPYLYVKSPQKQSGKTRLLEVLELLCRHAQRASSISEAAVFQMVEMFEPTLLIDETDALFASNTERTEPVRAVLNAGNRRGSKAIRGSREGTPVTYSSFCPKVLAGIDTGRLPDTIRDRSIVIALERKLREEAVERFRERDLAPLRDDLHGRLSDWAHEHRAALAGYRLPEPMLEITDRLEEAWEPLIAIADLAGGEWPKRARHAAVALAANTEDSNHSALLLKALKSIYGGRANMLSRELCKLLNADDDLPFGDYRRGQGIDGRGLAKLLKPYRVNRKDVRVGNEHGKGYAAVDLASVWQRYVDGDASDDHREDEQQEDARDDLLAGIGDNGDFGDNAALEPNPRGQDRGHVGDTGSSATDARSLSVTDRGQPQTPAQSQNGARGHRVTAVTDPRSGLRRRPLRPRPGGPRSST